MSSAPDEWFVSFPDGREIGPVTRPQLAAAMQGGKISSACQIFRSDWPQWRPAEEVASKLGIQLAANSSDASAANSLWNEVSPRDFKPPPPPPPPEKHGPSIVDQYMPPPPPPLSEREQRERIMAMIYCGAPYLVMLVLISALGGPILAIAAIVPGMFIIVAGLANLAIAVFKWPWLVDGPLFYINRALFGKELALTLIYIQGVLTLIAGYLWTGFVLFGACLVTYGQFLEAEELGLRGIPEAPTVPTGLRPEESSFETTDFSGPWGKAFAPFANATMAVKDQDRRIANMKVNIAKIQREGKMDSFMPVFNLQLQHSEERRAFLATFLQYGDKPPAKQVMQAEFDRRQSQFNEFENNNRNRREGTFLENKLYGDERSFRRQMAFEAGLMLQNWPVP